MATSHRATGPGWTIVVIAAVVTAIWFSVGYIDRVDGTCGSLVQPSTWLESDGCRWTMTARSITVGALLAIAVVGVVVVRRGGERHRLAGWWPAALGLVLAVLLLNEFLRSDGLWWRG